MKTKRKHSIFFKTQLNIIVFCALALCFLWFFETTFLRVYYRVYQTSNVMKIAKDISQNKLDRLETHSYENNVCITVYRDYGDIYEYNTKMNGCGFKKSIVQNEIYNFINNETKQKSLRINTDDLNGLLVGIKVDTADIFIYAPLETSDTVNKVLHGQLIYIIICAMVLCSVFAFFLTNSLTKPIRNITLKARNIGKENYHNEFEETGILEIDELNDTLNTVQKELSKIQDYQHDLLANVGHDLKTPLTMIKAYAEKIKDISYKDKNKMENDLNIIIDETNRLTILVNDILNYSKLESKNDELNYEEYDLVPEIKNIIEKYDIIKETENYKIITTLPDTAFIKADRNKLNQVIYNLINNAINYTGDNKEVYVDLIKEKNNFIFKVRDTGKGIKKSEQKNIWTKYYKNDKNHQRNVISTGLGLSIVKNILELHKFEYGVESTLKKGSTFYFRFISLNKHKNNTKKS